MRLLTLIGRCTLKNLTKYQIRYLGREVTISLNLTGIIVTVNLRLEIGKEKTKYFDYREKGSC